MAEPTPTTKPAVAPPKSFMAAGPTLHYSHDYVHRFWGLTVVVYVLVCFFWNRILIGGLISIVPADVIDPSLWSLGQFVTSPVSIYEYPYQILILGSLMGILAAAPVLIAQLYSFRYSFPLILAVMFIAKLYFFGLFVGVSCIAVACRPLRFRSRSISLALCMSPQVVYWAIWGGYTTADPIRWGFSYAPWIYAWLTGLVMGTVVLGVGHFTRYRPGLILTVSAVLLAATYGVFQKHIGFAELDYQLYVAGSNPEEVVEFHTNSLSNQIDEVIADDALRSYLIGIFYPTEPILLREKLKEEIQNLLVYNQWPQWFQKKMPERFRYQSRRRELVNRCREFMERRPQSKRMPIALYYTAWLNEYQPDVRYFGRTETLRFYHDYPFKDNILIWQELYDRFPQSPESLEARWRLARHDAAEGRFERAIQLCQVTQSMIQEQLGRLESDLQPDKESIWSAFYKPMYTAMTPLKLRDLDRRVRTLQRLIDRENQGVDEASRRRLAVFVGLNPYAMEYSTRLESLLREMGKDDPLRDNVLLARALLTPDARQRAAVLFELADTYQGTDAGIRARFEAAISLLDSWKDPQTDSPQRVALLEDIRTALSGFIAEHPDSIYADSAKMLLETLPAAPQP